MKHWTPTQNHNKQHTNIYALKPPCFHFFPVFTGYPHFHLVFYALSLPRWHSPCLLVIAAFSLLLLPVFGVRFATPKSPLSKGAGFDSNCLADDFQFVTGSAWILLGKSHGKWWFTQQKWGLQSRNGGLWKHKTGWFDWFNQQQMGLSTRNEACCWIMELYRLHW